MSFLHLCIGTLCLWLLLLDKAFVSTLSSPRSKVCGNVTISGTSLTEAEIKLELKKLTKCNVIEGNLEMNWLTFNSETSFPRLTEVTGFIMLHYVRGFITLAELFPLLVVIRGQQLFHNYGLILIGNMDLEEVGPWNFHSLLKGSVSVEDNVMMCVEPWSQWRKYIRTQEFQKMNFFKNNFNECPFADCEEEGYCEVRPKTCNLPGNSCFTDISCHPECLGGCRKSGDATSCAACENFLIGEECVANCPDTYYKYLDYRCLSKEECTGRSLRWTTFESDPKGSNFFNPSSNISVIERLCLPRCPFGQAGKCADEKMDATCEGAVVTRENMGDEFRHCTVINGSLTIMVTGGDRISLRLRKNLGNIIKITGFLSITASNALYSLSFLTSLTVIEGKETKYNGCAFCVLENPNLEEFWVWKQRKANLTVRGLIYVGFNSHLTEDVINELLTNTNHDESSVAPYTNGRNAPRFISKSTITAVPNSIPGSVKIKWEHNYCGVDDREIDGYYIFYRQTDKNITIFEDRDACSDLEYMWGKVILQLADLPYLKKDKKCLHFDLDRLLPNTRYAIYARTFSLEGSYHAVYTDLTYVTTSPIYPDDPEKGEVIRDSSEEITISWSQLSSSPEPKYEVTILVGKEPETDLDFKFIGNCTKFDEILKNRLLPLDKEVKNSRSKSASFNKIPEVSSFACSCSTDIDATKEILKREKENGQLEREINGLLMIKSRTKKTEPKTLSRKQVNLERGKMSNCDQRSHSGQCPKPIVNWTNSELVMEEILLPKDWTKQSLEGFYLKVKHTNLNRLSIKLPPGFEKLQNVKVEVTVRAYNAEQTPCTVISNVVSSCALFSNNYTWTTHLVNISVMPDVQVSINTTETNLVVKHLNLNSCKFPNMFDQAVLHESFNSSKLTSENHKKEPRMKISWDGPQDSLRNQVFGYRIKYYQILHKTEITPMDICFSKASAEEINNQWMIPVSPYKLYGVRLQVRNRTGYSYSDHKCLQFDEFGLKMRWSWVALSGFTVFLLIGAVVILFIVISLKKKPILNVTENNSYGMKDSINEALELIDDCWWKKRDHLTNLQKVAEGEFGCVYKAKLKRDLVVAVKTTKSVDKDKYKLELNALLQEAINILRLQGPEVSDGNVTRPARSNFIVEFIGICKEELRDGPKYFVILEYMNQNDLNRYLKDKKTHLSEEKMLEILVQIADGLTYLAHYKVVHRDIAARNIMVDSSKSFNPLVKIGDFGLTRHMEGDYYRLNVATGTKILPVRYMAPESLAPQNLSNEKSEVWSYGILIWEILTKCKENPYKESTIKEVLDGVPKGELKLKPCPESSPQYLLKLKDTCLNFEPSSRDNFHSITMNLMRKCSSSFQEKFRLQSFTVKTSKRDSESTEGYNNDEGCFPGCSLDNSQDDEDSSSKILLSSSFNDDGSFQEYSRQRSCISINLDYRQFSCGSRHWSGSENLLSS